MKITLEKNELLGLKEQVIMQIYKSENINDILALTQALLDSKIVFERETKDITPLINESRQLFEIIMLKMS